MILDELTIEGFKCFRHKTCIPFHNLTVLIGENDSGKTTILKALGLLLGKSSHQEEDFYNLDGEQLTNFTIIGRFKINPNNTSENIKSLIIDGYLTLKKVFSKDKLTFVSYVLKNSFIDEDLENYLSLSALQTKDLLAKYELPERGNQEERREELKQFIEDYSIRLPKAIKEVEIGFNTINQELPYFEYYASHEYGNPQYLIKKTLETIIRNKFHDEHGLLKINSLQKFYKNILQKLNESIEKNLLVQIQKYNSRIENIRGKINIDFVQSLIFQGLEIDEGQGFKSIDQKGEGSKKRLFLSILEWDKEVQLLSQKARPIIRAYDEPDSNLHYEAQRKMFYAISEVANNPNSNTQAVIATHSISMIDRAPCSSINHITQVEGISNINYLKTDGDLEIHNFLNQISIIGGIKNSSIFYEKCFLIVEGDSEEAIMGNIYKKWFGCSMTEDGIVLINLKSNGAWYSFLKLLKSNKKDSTIMLLDKDTQNVDCGAKVTPAKLNDIGFDSEFLKNNVYFAGIQEFEDLYPDNRIKEAFNALYPKPKNKKWTLSEIQQIRINYPKISKGLRVECEKYITHHHQKFRKPEFAIKIFDLISEREIKRISVFQKLFDRIDYILGY